MKNRIAVAVLAVALSVGMSGCAAADVSVSGSTGTETEAAAAGTIVISSSESEMGTPDLATISFGIQTQETEADSAQKNNSETTDKVVAALKKLSIKDSDIQTASYNLYPQYDYSNDSISGYQAQTTLSVKNQKVDEVGKIVSAAVAAGANTVSDIQYSCSSYDDLYRTALQNAIAAAREKAEAAATAAGKTLGSIASIQETPGSDYYRNYSSTNASMEGSAASDSASLSIMPGEVEITAQVTVTYNME